MMTPEITQQSNPLPGVPLVESPFFKALLNSSGFDDETRRVAIDLYTKGYAVIDFPEPDFDSIAESIKSSLHSQYDFQHWEEVGHAAGISLRIQDAWQFDDNVRRIACNQSLIELLSRLYGRQAWPFQTLNFPVGTQQHFHSDSMHFSSVPERFMCGVWVAMEDITLNNGPLVYYPGSHKWPIYTNEHVGVCVSELEGQPTQALYESMWRAMVAANDAKPEYFTAKKGQGLIWAANLIHGGSPHNDKNKTRWSQVTHYFFENCAYYTPMTSDPFYGHIDFRDLTNLVTGKPVHHNYVGNAVPPLFVGLTRPSARFWQGGFDPTMYLLANSDVAASGANPAEHFLRHGMRENRPLRPHTLK